jgi:hypothetical protein
MPNYQDGKIYTIRNYADNEMVYVGSTTQTLSRRLAKHRGDCKTGVKVSLYSHITDNDWSNWYIELYEYYPCNNRTELDRREGEVIRDIGTINKCIAGRTPKEWREDNVEYIKKYREDNAEYFKEYREDNAEYFKEYQKKWREGNPEYYKEYYKKYYEDNSDKIKEKDKKYYEKNADKIKEKVCCNICGAFSSKNNLERHQKSKKCMSALN